MVSKKEKNDLTSFTFVALAEIKVYTLYSVVHIKNKVYIYKVK